jgi:hypothetical protein
MSMSLARSRLGTVSARMPNSFARALAAAASMSAQARISMPLNRRDSLKYAAEILPQPTTPTPSFLAILVRSYSFRAASIERRAKRA